MSGIRIVFSSKLRNYSAGEVFSTTVQFSLGCNYLSRVDPPLVFSLLANVAFSIELLFKTLIILDGKPPIRNTHNLNSLFKKLSPDTQNAIQQEWDALIRVGTKREALDFLAANGDRFDRQLTTALALAADAFVEFRYAHEMIKLPAMYLQGLEQRIVGMILRREPDFEKLIPHFE